MALTASQHRKAVREGRIADSRQLSAISHRSRRIEAQRSALSGQRSAVSTQYTTLNAEAVARRLAVCEPCPHRVVSAVGAAGERWLCQRCELPDFRCPRTMDLRRKAAIAEAVCYEGKWEE